MEIPSIHDFVVKRLQAQKGAWPAVSVGSGVPYGTLKKVATRESRPRIDTLEKLAAYFHALDALQPQRRRRSRKLEVMLDVGSLAEKA